MTAFCRIVFLLLSGSPSHSLPSPTAHHYFSKEKTDHAAHWSFDGPTCHGKHQSPIALSRASEFPAKLPALLFDYRPEKISALNNGHTIQHDGGRVSFLHIGAETFSLEQFHFHSPSEHTLEGKRFPMEIHFVHKSKSGEVVVVAVFVEQSATATLKNPMQNDLPSVDGESVTLEATRNPADFLPTSREYLSYAGSFTTPPCTEGVRWVVLREPLRARPEIVAKVAAILKSNNRPLQALNDRVVRRYVQ